MPKGYTLRTLLAVVNTTLADWYDIELISNKGIKLVFAKDEDCPSLVGVSCWRPGKPFIGACFDNDCEKPCDQTIKETFHLKLDVPCWHVAPMTFANMDAMIAIVNAIKKDWEPFKEDSSEKENAP